MDAKIQLADFAQKHKADVLFIGLDFTTAILSDAIAKEHGADLSPDAAGMIERAGALLGVERMAKIQSDARDFAKATAPVVTNRGGTSVIGDLYDGLLGLDLKEDPPAPAIASDAPA